MGRRGDPSQAPLHLPKIRTDPCANGVTLTQNFQEK